MGPGPQQRPRWLSVALLIGVVVAAGLLSYLLRPDDVRERPIQREPAPQSLDVEPARRSVVRSVDFADERHGILLRRWCGSNVRCHDHIMVTSDGERWTEASVPEPHAVQYERTVHALGRCRFVLHDAGLTSGRIEHTWFSDDCATAWRPVEPRPRGTTDRIPPHATLTVECRGDDCTDYLAVTMPKNGQRRWLTSTPWLLEPSVLPVQAPDDGWWVIGRNPLTQQPVVAASYDSGRNWSVERLPLRPDVDPTLVIGPTGNAYVFAPDSTGTVTVLHSADRGSTWLLTATLESGLVGPQTVTGGLVRPDDVLVIDEAGRYWSSADHGHAFVRTELPVPITEPRWTRGGYVAVAEDSWYHSPDGVTWQEITFPGS